MSKKKRKKPLAYSVGNLAELTGLSKHSIYRDIWAGKLGAVKVRNRLVIPAAEVEKWLTPVAAPEGETA